MNRRRQFRPRGTHRRQLLKPWPKEAVLGLTAVLFIIGTIWGLAYVSKSLKPALTAYADFEAKQAMTYAMNYALSNLSLTDLSTQSSIVKKTPMESHNELFYKKLNPQGDLVSISADPAKAAAFLQEKTQRLEDFLYAVDSGNITIEQNSAHIIKLNSKPTERSVTIPLGVASQMALFGNFGPKIPVRTDYISSLTTSLHSEVKAVGINSVELTLYVQAKTNARLILPFRTKEISIVKDIPVAEMTYQGAVPKYYSPDNKNSSPPKH